MPEKLDNAKKDAKDYVKELTERDTEILASMFWCGQGFIHSLYKKHSKEQNELQIKIRNVFKKVADILKCPSKGDTER